MDINLILKGFIVGFSVAAPIGPISILCINSTLNKGKKYGLSVGLGATIANIILLLIVGLGLTLLSGFVINYINWFKIIGGILLIILGISIFKKKTNSSKRQKVGHKNYTDTLILSFFYTLISPISILLFIAIFASAHITKDFNYSNLISQLALGVFLGSMIWWIILSTIIDFFREKVNHSKLVIINKVSGIIILCFGCLELIKGVINKL